MTEKTILPKEIEKGSGGDTSSTVWDSIWQGLRERIQAALEHSPCAFLGQREQCEEFKKAAGQGLDRWFASIYPEIERAPYPTKIDKLEKVRLHLEKLGQALKKENWTYDDCLFLDECVRCELIGGYLYMCASPSVNHQRISRNLSLMMWKYVQENDLGEIFFAPLDVILDPRHAVQPEILFVAKAHQEIVQERIKGSPELVVEILSPESDEHDRVKKRSLYARFGIQEYWIVAPECPSLDILSLAGTEYETLCSVTGSGIVYSNVIPGLRIDVAKLQNDGLSRGRP